MLGLLNLCHSLINGPQILFNVGSNSLEDKNTVRAIDLESISRQCGHVNELALLKLQVLGGLSNSLAVLGAVLEYWKRKVSISNVLLHFTQISRCDLSSKSDQSFVFRFFFAGVNVHAIPRCFAFCFARFLLERKAIKLSKLLHFSVLWNRCTLEFNHVTLYVIWKFKA